MVMALTFLYEFGVYILNVAINDADLEIISFLKINIIEIIFNSILTIIIYPLIKKGGYYIQEVYRGNRILTRYF